MGQFSDSTSDQVGEYYQAQAWKAEGIKEERERIIKLLEEDSLGLVGCGCCAESDMQDVIALIRGESE